MDSLNSELRKFVAPEIVFGIGALAQIGACAKKFNPKKVMLVTDPGIVRAGWVDVALKSLKQEAIPVVVYEEVTPNPKDYEVAAGSHLYRTQGCDVIIAVGGGSPMDCAKGIGIVAANGKEILDFEGVDEVPNPGPPLICAPTTAGSSADVSQFAIITDTERKLKIAIISKAVVPDTALIDPRTTVTMPTELAASTGMDALVHAMEAYVSNASSPLTDLHARAAISLVVENLVLALENPDRLDYRNNMTLGSMLAGLAFSNASLGLVHAMAHSLGGLLDLPHGACNALLLERVVDYNYPSAPCRYDEISQSMHLKLDGMSANERKNSLLERIARLREASGITGELFQFDLTPTLLAQLVTNTANDPCLLTNPCEPSLKEIEAIYESVFRRS